MSRRSRVAPYPLTSTSGQAPARVSRWWAMVPFLSGGFLSFVPFLRIAVARKRRRDWIVFGFYLAATLVVTGLANSVSKGSAARGPVDFLVVALIVVATGHTFGETRTLSAPPASYTLPVSYPGTDPVNAARARIARREEVRELVAGDPVLARELQVGRPDLTRQFDDGGLIDVNAVPSAILVQQLRLTAAEADAVLAAREHLGRFTSPEELSVYAQLPPDKVDAVRDLLWFG